MQYLQNILFLFFLPFYTSFSRKIGFVLFFLTCLPILLLSFYSIRGLLFPTILKNILLYFVIHNQHFLQNMEKQLYFLILCLLISFSLGQILYFSSESLPEPIKLIDGGRSSIYFVGSSNIIHPMYTNNGSLLFGTDVDHGGTINRLIYSTANKMSETFFGVLMENSVILMEQNTQKNITSYTHSISDVQSFSMGKIPTSLYYLIKPAASPAYIQKYDFSVDTLYSEINPPADFLTINIYFSNNVVVCCGNDGRMLLRKKTGEIEEFGYRHYSTITFIDLDLDEELMWTGDMEGNIIMANGTIKTSFDEMIQYQEHNCSIVSVVRVGEFLVSSDECGMLVQFDFINNVTIHRMFHPDLAPNDPVSLTQYMDEGFGVSGKANDDTVYLYNIDNVINDTDPYQSQQPRPEAGVIFNLLREVSKRIVMVPCIRWFLKFSMPWMVWLEDLYYYSYHRYDYNQGVKIFLMEMYFINEEKINPVLAYAFEKNYLSQHLKFNTTGHQGRYPIRNLPENQVFDMYFLEYTKSLYVESLLQQLVFFLLVKVIFYGLRKCLTDKKKFLILMEFQGNTIIWFFFLSFLLDNSLYLAFACSAQIRSTFSLTFMDKVNLVSSVICFFILIAFAIGFFMLTLSFFPNKRLAQSALYQCEPTKKGFLIECLIFGTKNILNGVIHGFILDNHELQIILLMSVGFLIAVGTWIYRKQFSYRVSLWFTLFYHSGFATFNLLVLLQRKQVKFWYLKMEDLHFYILVALLGIVVIRFLIEIVIFLKDRIDFRIKVTNFLEKLGFREKNNKILPHPENNSMKQKQQKKKSKEVVEIISDFSDVSIVKSEHLAKKLKRKKRITQIEEIIEEMKKKKMTLVLDFRQQI